MFNQVKTILWLFSAVLLCLSALIYSLHGITIQNQALDTLVPTIHGQKHSISVGYQEVMSEKYSGTQIIYSLHNLHHLGAVVEVNEQLIEIDHEIEELEVELPPVMREPSIIDPSANYEVSYMYGQMGQLERIIFTKIS